MSSKPIFDLTGNVAVVTGASAGLGIQFAKALAAQGADIAICARRGTLLNETAEEIRGLGVKCLAVSCDITKAEEVKSFAAAVMKEYGRIDILVNNAGMVKIKSAEEVADQEWQEVMNVNLNGTFRMAREIGRIMIQQGYGRIINISSMLGMVGSKVSRVIAYEASKGAIINMTRGLAAEWGASGITVNAICPGTFLTELTRYTADKEEYKVYTKTAVPIGRYGEDGELDTTVVYLASPASSYVNGAVIPVDGGFTCI